MGKSKVKAKGNKDGVVVEAQRSAVVEAAARQFAASQEQRVEKFNQLVETGRTDCTQENLSNPPRKDEATPERRFAILADTVGALRKKYRGEKETLVTEARIVVNKAMRAALEQRSANGKVHEDQMNTNRKKRDAQRAQIEKDYKLALQKAQSDRDIAHNQLDKEFTAAREGLDKWLAEQNAPHDAAYEKVATETADALNTQLKVMQDAYSESVKPMADEMRAIKEKLKVDQKEKTSELPDEPAPEQASAVS